MVGFTLVELLVALTVTVSVFATAIAMALPAAGGFRTLPEHIDVQQRLRTAVETLRADVRTATSRPAIGSLLSLAASWPAIRPCGWDGDPVSGSPGPCARPDALSLVVADRPLQVVTAGRASPGDVAVTVTPPPGCPPAAAACRFRAGDRALVANGMGSVDAFQVRWASPDGTRLEHDGTLTATYGPGAVVVSSRVLTYYTRDDPESGLLQLRRIDGGSDLPVLDHLTAFSVEYFGAPDPPALVIGPDGEVHATYGPLPPRARQPAAGEGAAETGSCAFEMVDGVPVSRLRPLAADTDGLAVLPLSVLSDGPWCPDAGAPLRFDADLFRVRRLRLTIRSEAASVFSRGQHPALFGAPGRARDAARLVPGLSVRLDLALRGAE